ncbi:alpha/beta hydrolase [Pseudomonas fluorescens]|uniref:alpha/beta hydrolase n=1 Tax=Pseudomonas fluorescens TaxID=294 RepID=UPI001A9F664B|nr:alpha/beta hydrolase [Pseudomonas fluorescens]QTD30684.1 alpha/beta hydrolase [Pseudomonas fluorescens]
MTGRKPVQPYTHIINPSQGRWKNCLLIMLLRLAVKSRHGLHIDIPELRKKFALLDQQASKDFPAGVCRENVRCDGAVAQWLEPLDCKKERVLLYIHGGAFVAYTPDAYAAMVASWCKRLKARALMVDYPLAPENPFPTALEKCLVAYRWLLEQGTQASDIVIAGDSAGGNLVMAVLQHLKINDQPLPRCAVLLSPFLDLTLSGSSALSNARRDPIFTLPFAVGIRRFYASAEQYSQPGVSPLFGVFEGLPPLLLQVGSTEMLLDDSVRAAEMATAAGVPVRLEIWQSMPHVFQMVLALPQAHLAAQNIHRFINDHTDWGG